MSDSPPSIEQAWQHFHAGRFAELFAIARQLVEREPSSAAWHLLGLAWFRQRAFPAALEALQQAALLAPNDSAIAANIVAGPTTPLVSCQGETIASRQTFAVLNAIGVTETVAVDRQDYVRRAVALAGNVEQLAILRRTIRERYDRAGIDDGARLAQDLTDALRELWRRWCQRGR